MDVETTPIPDCLLITPQVFGDHRGSFQELYHLEKYQQAGINPSFVQDNYSRSTQGILRGLHFQQHHQQGKLVQAIRGRIFDVAVDLRPQSPAYRKWFGTELNDELRQQLYIPPGCAHGFLVLSEQAEVLYKCTDLYYPEEEFTLMWNDPTIGIEWPLTSEPVLSGKDQQGHLFDQLPALKN